MSMIAKLLALFTIIPLIELSLLIPLGQRIGTEWTLAIVFTTALVGAILGKFQGASAWKRIKQDLATGQIPGDSLLDGLAVLVASAFLVTPGVLTDLTGFILLLPPTRRPLKALLRRRIDRWLEADDVGFVGFDGGMMGGFDDHDTYRSPHAREDDIVIEPAPKTSSPEQDAPEQDEQEAPRLEVLPAERTG